MEIRKMKVNGNNYEFVNTSRSTRSGFAHDTTLFINDCEYGRTTCYYYNRTWECYRYQTVMKRCVSDMIERKYKRYIENYKAENNIKRMTAEKSKDAEILFENLTEIKELRKVYKRLEKKK